MKNNNLNIYGPLLFLMVIIGSCSDEFLEVIPKGQQIAVKTEDYDLLLNNQEFYLYERSGGMQTVRWMGDEIAAESAEYLPNHPMAQRLFNWVDVVYPDVADTQFDSPFDLKPLGNIYAYNKVINEVMDSQDGTETQKLALRAEAMAFRSVDYFILANVFTKPYSAGTAGTDLGFPVFTGSDITFNDFSRGTVQDTYDFIVDGLTEAIPDLPLDAPFRTRMTKSAAEGLLGKVYMFMGKFDEALPFLNAAFDDIGAMGDPPRLYDHNIEFGPEGSFLPINPFSGPRGPGNDQNDITESVFAKICYAGQFNGNGPGNNGVVLTPESAALFGSSDHRLNFYDQNHDFMVPNPNGNLRKYGVRYTRFGLELSELYLLRAECRARLNDLAGAVADVQALREKRMPPGDATVPDAIASDQTELIKFILEERIREFATEGYRWLDMRRLSVDPDPELSETIEYTHTLYDDSGIVETYTLRPERFVVRFPRSYIDANPGMENNP